MYVCMYVPDEIWTFLGLILLPPLKFDLNAFVPVVYSRLEGWIKKDRLIKPSAPHVDGCDIKMKWLS